MAAEISDNAEKFDCRKCQFEHRCGDDVVGYPQSKGCASFDFLKINLQGFEFSFNRCVLPMITQRTYYFFRLFKDYKRGNLLTSGGVNNQPNVYMQAMRLLSGD